MAIRLGDTAPDFKAETTVGEISFHEWLGENWGILYPNADDTLTLRSVFVIDPAKKVRLTLTYPAATGRNFDEILRVVDSLQLTTNFQVATPANWQEGDDCIISNAIPEDELDERFPDGYETIKPYLRTTRQPGR